MFVLLQDHGRGNPRDVPESIFFATFVVQYDASTKAPLD